MWDPLMIFESTTSIGFVGPLFVASVLASRVFTDPTPVFYAMLGLLYTSRVAMARLLHCVVTHPSSPLVSTIMSDPKRNVPVHKEHEWVIPLYMHLVIFGTAHHVIGLASVPVVHTIWVQLVHGILAHNLLTEPMYYLMHRWLHIPAVFKRMHAYHHEHHFTGPTTGLVQDFVEHLLYMVVFGAYFVLGTLLGYSFSVWYVLVHMIVFDICNALGHFDVEWWPEWFLDSPLRFIFYTPSYHAVHHREYGHFCLFSPFWDWVFGTYRHTAYKKIFKRLSTRIPPSTTAVFLGHYLGPSSALHTPWVSRFRAR